MNGEISQFGAGGGLFGGIGICHLAACVAILLVICCCFGWACGGGWW
ncbi:MAG: hypothetical protein HPY50_18250 [Firmicutes bacterium]|nr:hypothetical protein [Bacillota bacterium]